MEDSIVCEKIKIILPESSSEVEYYEESYENVETEQERGTRTEQQLDELFQKTIDNNNSLKRIVDENFIQCDRKYINIFNTLCDEISKVNMRLDKLEHKHKQLKKLHNKLVYSRHF